MHCKLYLHQSIKGTIAAAAASIRNAIFHSPWRDRHISSRSPSGLAWHAYLHSEGMVACDNAEFILRYSSVCDNFLRLCSQSLCDIMSPAGSPA